jgi:hypothetical protein
MSLNYSVDNMRDFDQKWDALPNDGKMYCVPTSFTNMMAFLSDRGHPTLWRKLPFGPGSGTKYSQQNLLYNIGIMANYMDTDPQDGTGNGGALDGLEDFVAGRYLGAWYSRACSNDDSIRIHNLENHFALKRIGAVCFGRYERDNPNDSKSYDRMSGHCITLTGLKVSGSNAKLYYHDPARGDENINAQSATQEHELPVSNASIKVDGDWRYGIKMETSGNLRMIDSYFIMAPFFLTDYDDFNNIVSFSQEVNTNGVITIETRKADMKSTVGTVKNMVTDAEGTVAYITSKEKKGIWKMPLHSMKPELIAEDVQPDKLTIGEDGETIFFSYESKIFSLSPDKKPELLTTLNEKPEALAYDLKRKQLIVSAPKAGLMYTVDKNKKVDKLDIPKVSNDDVQIGFDYTGDKMYTFNRNAKTMLWTPIKKGMLDSVSEQRFQSSNDIRNLRPAGKNKFVAVENNKLKFFDEKGDLMSTAWDNRAVGSLNITPIQVKPVDSPTSKLKKWKN